MCEKNWAAALQAIPAAVKTAEALGFSGDNARQVANKIVYEFTGVDVCRSVAVDGWMSTEAMADELDLDADEMLTLLVDVGYVAKTNLGYRMTRDGLSSHRLAVNDFTGELSLEWNRDFLDEVRQGCVLV